MFVLHPSVEIAILIDLANKTHYQALVDVENKYIEKCSYASALECQQAAYASSSSGLEVIGFEPEAPVLTLGYSAKLEKECVVPAEIETLKVDRGGAATIHAPGQLVLFPVWRLNATEKGIKQRIDSFFLALKKTVKEAYGIEAECKGLTGLFTERGKMGFAGMRVKDKKVLHGFSLNVHNDLGLFESIRSCGVKDMAHDSISSHTGSRLSCEEVFAELCKNL